MRINYKFESLNNYINKCRSNPYYANNVKQKETKISQMAFKGVKVRCYPITLVFKWHIKSKIADLDGRLPKNIIDGMVKSGTIVDDNVKYIKKIIHEYIPDTEDSVEVEIIENNIDNKYCMTRSTCNGCPKEEECEITK